MSAMASQNNRRLDGLLNRLFRRNSKKYQSSALLAFVEGIQRWLVNSPYEGPITRKIFLFDDIIMLRISPRESTGRFCSNLTFSALTSPFGWQQIILTPGSLIPWYMFTSKLVHALVWNSTWLCVFNHRIIRYFISRYRMNSWWIHLMSSVGSARDNSEKRIWSGRTRVEKDTYWRRYGSIQYAIHHLYEVLWIFFTVDQTFETPLIWDAIALIMTSL